jgi:dienelactone hydrolase
MVIRLLSHGETSLLSCGVICHPGPEGKKYYTPITKPTQWHLADHDMRFKDPQIAELRQVAEGKKEVVMEITVHPGMSQARRR